MSLPERSADMPTRPRIPRQRSTTVDLSRPRPESGGASVDDGRRQVEAGLSARGWVVLRVLTGLALVGAGAVGLPTTTGSPVGWVVSIGLLLVGVMVVSGVGLWISAVAGAVLLLVAAFAGLDRVAGVLGRLPVVEAAVLVALAAGHAGRAWGLGRTLGGQAFVRRHGWLR